MAAEDHLNRRQFKLSHFSVDDDPQGSHMLEAHTGNGRKLGIMTWKGGQINNVVVKEKWQRQGMATQMWNRANEITPGLRHSDNRTDAGDAWAKKVSGSVPERAQDHPEWYR